MFPQAIIPLLQILRDVLQHLVSCRDGLGIHLISALRFNHVHHLFNHIDVGTFNEALLQGTQTIQAGVAGQWRSAGTCLEIEVFTTRFEARGVYEIG